MDSRQMAREKAAQLIWEGAGKPEGTRERDWATACVVVEALSCAEVEEMAEAMESRLGEAEGILCAVRDALLVPPTIRALVDDYRAKYFGESACGR